jgi:hypothetical protein
MALIEDDASAYIDHLPPDRQKYRYPMNGIPEIRKDLPPEEERIRDTCLDALRNAD